MHAFQSKLRALTKKEKTEAWMPNVWGNFECIQ